MSATVLGSVLACVGVLATALVGLLGKRSETALNGYTSLTDQLQEERAEQQRQITELRQQLVERDARISELAAHRSEDQAELTRLRTLLQAQGGQPS